MLYRIFVKAIVSLAFSFYQFYQLFTSDFKLETTVKLLQKLITSLGLLFIYSSTYIGFVRVCIHFVFPFFFIYKSKINLIAPRECTVFRWSYFSQISNIITNGCPTRMKLTLWKNILIKLNRTFISSWVSTRKN